MMWGCVCLSAVTTILVHVLECAKLRNVDVLPELHWRKASKGHMLLEPTEGCMVL